MMSNYIWDRQHPARGTVDRLEPLPNLVGMITFGCNIPLFALAFPRAKPIDLPGQGVRKPELKIASRWLNFLDRDDVLGWPLKPLYAEKFDRLSSKQQGTVTRIHDFEINVGSVFTSWNVASHSNYWTDNDLTRPIASYLREVLAAART